MGLSAEAIAFDVSDEAGIASAIAAIDAAHGRLDILVNNAGIAIYGGVEELEPADWRRVLDVDLTSLFLLSRAAQPLLARSGSGRIINIASVLGLISRAGIVSYVAAKHGVVGLTRALAGELGRYGITCNAIAPGYFLTPMGDDLAQGRALLSHDLRAHAARAAGQSRKSYAARSSSSPPTPRRSSPGMC